MFGIAFSIFSTISYIFYSNTDFLSKRIGENTAKLINKISVMNAIKAAECRGCDSIVIYQQVPQKIGGSVYNITFDRNSVAVLFFGNKINSTNLNINETYSFSGNANSNNKKIEIKINNKLKHVKVE
jgi:hypothetical protein